MIKALATFPTTLGMALSIAVGTFSTARANESESQNPHPCAREQATMVCHRDGWTLRVVEETISPSGRYAVAWVVPEDATAIARLKLDPTDGSISFLGGGPENAVVRLRDGAIIAD
ncbi:hypothetical protein, partial [Streptococcus pyogenes]|uniref:hypothetical protein n=1 Tax=Streptococcus pyogenes TaxID=1314 RepID=UPI0011E677EF